MLVWCMKPVDRFPPILFDKVTRKTKRFLVIIGRTYRTVLSRDEFLCDAYPRNVLSRGYVSPQRCVPNWASRNLEYWPWRARDLSLGNAGRTTATSSKNWYVTSKSDILIELVRMAPVLITRIVFSHSSFAMHSICSWVSYMDYTLIMIFVVLKVRLHRYFLGDWFAILQSVCALHANANPNPAVWL